MKMHGVTSPKFISYFTVNLSGCLMMSYLW